MNTPNYSLLLQSLWTPPTTPIAENSHTNNHPPEPTEITEFLGEELLYQQTISATEPNLKTIPKDLPKQLIKALESSFIFLISAWLSAIARPLMANMAMMIWLNCRIVVTFISGSRHCNNVRISNMGCLWLSSCFFGRL